MTGLQAAVGVDASAMAGGTLEFDFKEVSPPPDGSQWHIKLESGGAATYVDILMTTGGNPTPSADWQAYSFDLDTDLAGLDLSDLTLVLFFPRLGERRRRRGAHRQRAPRAIAIGQQRTGETT